MSLAGLNPIVSLIENLNILTSKFNRPISEILVIEFCPICFFALGLIVTIKYFFVILLCACLVGVAANAGPRMLLVKDKFRSYPQTYLIKQFKMMLLLFTIIKNLVAQIALSLIVFGQLFLTISAWFSVNCYSIFPTFVTLTSVATFFGGVAFSICLMTIFTNAHLDSFELIQKKRKEFIGKYYGKWSHEKFISRKWLSLQPLPIYCGRHFAFSKHAMINFADILSCNVTNAVLLFLP